MTADDVIQKAWAMVGDVGATKRNPESDMIGFLNDGMRDIQARRPFLTLADDGTRDTVTMAALAADVLYFDDTYGEPLAHYIAYRIFEIDAEDENNSNQSTRHFARYLALI